MSTEKKIEELMSRLVNSESFNFHEVDGSQEPVHKVHSNARKRKQTATITPKINNLISTFPNLKESISQITPQKAEKIADIPNLTEVQVKKILDIRDCYKQLPDDDFLEVLTELEQYDDSMYLKIINDNLFDCNDMLKNQLASDAKDLDWKELFQNHILGKIVENYYCQYFKCPICDSPLVQYKAANFPVYDFACSSIHESKPKKQHQQYSQYFQLKCKFNNSDYFSDTHIVPSQSKYTDAFHSFAPNSINKQYAINYICLHFKKQGDDIVKFSKNTSYILKPCLETESAAPFYYKTGELYFKKPKYKWENCTKNKLDLDFENIDFSFHPSPIKKLSYEQKYLKYKNKYLTLKYRAFD